MKPTLPMLSADWGSLAKYRNITTFRLSPYELKPFAGFFSQGIPNLFRRFRGQVFRVSPPFIFAYLLYDWAEAENIRVYRKNKKDFKNDI